jgi:hypothetical protein
VNKFQLSCLRFLRKHQDISAAQMYLMWQHVCPSSYIPEMDGIDERIYRRLPDAPSPNLLFSASETESAQRLLFSLRPPRRHWGWALVNRCVWERLFPDAFPHKVAGKILMDAYDADSPDEWVEAAMQKDHPYYAAVFDLRAADVVRLASEFQTSPDEFKQFVAEQSTAVKPTARDSRHESELESIVG